MGTSYFIIIIIIDQVQAHFKCMCDCKMDFLYVARCTMIFTCVPIYYDKHLNVIYMSYSAQ